MERAILICGLVRAEAHFLDYLDGVHQLGVPGLRIIYSTWIGELDRYPEARRKLDAVGAFVVEQEHPDLKLPGHILHQTLTLELGLSLLEDDVFVLKTRPDICGVMDVSHFMELTPERLGPSLLPCPFTHRVFVVGMFGAHPTYINDIIFAGRAGDLRRLVWMPITLGPKFPRLSAEQWIWSGVFAPGNAILEAYLSVNPGLVFSDPARHEATRAVLSASPLFARAIAVAAQLTHDTLGYLHPEPQLELSLKRCARQTVEALLWDDLAIPGIDHHPLAKTNIFISPGPMTVLQTGTWRESPLGGLIRWFQTEMRGGRWPSRAELTKEACALAEALQREAGIGEHQTPVDAERSRTVRRGPPAWRLAGGSDVAVLEQEINAMRRTIDALIRERK